MPGPAQAPVEAEYETRSMVWMSRFMRYTKELCEYNSCQNTLNHNIGQELVVKSLGKKISKGKLVILEADKGKRFVVTDLKMYKSMAADHTSKDQGVGPERVSTA